MLTFSADNMAKFMEEAYAAAGLGKADAALAANFMLKTNLWGLDSHGVLRLPIYIKRLLNGAVKANADIKAVSQAGAIEVFDGDDGLGYIIGQRAMTRAMELAGSHGIGAVTVRSGNHFGAAALYSRMAAEAGFMGMAATNVGPNMVAPGGAGAIAGNNPIAFAFPSRDAFPFSLDISMSNVAGGKLLLAAEKGEKIPLDWAADKDGKPTDDPKAGFAGFLLPLGGHKGMALSWTIDIMCGILSGGAFLHDILSMYKEEAKPSNTSYFFMAVNIDRLIGIDNYHRNMEEFRKKIKASPMWDKTREMLIPGELEYRCEQRRRQAGLPIPESLYEQLKKLAGELGIKTELKVIQD